MKIGIIGIGKMGKFHAKTVLNHTETELTGVYDIDDLVADTFIKSQKENGVELKKFSNLKEIVLANDAVIIATPATTHNEVIKSVYKHSKIHILCEKPLIPSFEDYEVLFYNTLADTNIIHIGLCERHNELIPFLKPIDIDKIKSITFVRHNTTTRNTDVNIIWDTMIHDIDLLYYLFPTIKLNKIKIKKSDYIDDKLVHLICTSEREKYIFDCAKGMKEIKRYIEIKLHDGSKLNYDLANLIIEYGTYYTTVLKSIVQQNTKDKLTIQLDNFILGMREEYNTNANIHDVNKCMLLVDLINQKIKNEPKGTM
jgi:predicted dehydrogenase